MIDPGFQAVNRLLCYHLCYLPKAQIKGGNIMIDEKTVYEKPIKSYIKSDENIKNILLLVKEINKLLVAGLIILISKKMITELQQIYVNNKHVMLTQRRDNKLILLQI